ncbi:vitamin K-dependent gamma-carboxylase-like protein [Algoriphagus ratkowskyi]|uniref:Vitamin K-dependent gamma-carboxylase-like protein n=2 Tax=Algoriphagus ratkowskyi TaxID=57028 RepID=A0A2W7R2S3_9BACT|nr:HTTM domain-containing protein [Algoriphagus ratkowskyi]PZX53506.1 vitamin K-dependent gamma-carboxylase-like protein [Algoriphagus ratkowskyi]
MMVTDLKTSFSSYLNQTSSAAALAVFRMMFGVLMMISMLRFWYKGWIFQLYIEPKHHFTFYGFEWIKPLGPYTYLLFIVAMLSALFICIGLFYRGASILFFLSFTYIELMDKTTYLNHYYFISLLSFLLIFLPANAYFSVDAWRKPSINSDKIPSWCTDSIRLLVVILYFYAGLAKLNSDWLFHALPMKIWLPAKNDIPLIGGLFNELWVAYLFSWIACLYDLSIAFLLLYKPTRKLAFLSVVTFHLLTSLLFPIGMFPYIMIGTAMIFFSTGFHQALIGKIAAILTISHSFLTPVRTYSFSKVQQNLATGGLLIFFSFQLLFPFRYLLYPGELFWTEEGYRFSWRVMLMEKMGAASFIVKDELGKIIEVDNEEFLTPQQEKMMATQPDMMLQYAHILKEHYEIAGFKNPEIYADTYVSLNGRIGKALIDPTVDLSKEKESFRPKHWILPFQDEIKGL